MFWQGDLAPVPGIKGHNAKRGKWLSHSSKDLIEPCVRLVTLRWFSSPHKHHYIHFELDGVTRNASERKKVVLPFHLLPCHPLPPLSINALFCLSRSPCCSSFTHSGLDSDSRPDDRPFSATLHFISKLLLLAPHLLWKFAQRGKWNEMEYHFKYFHFWNRVDLGTCKGFKDRGDEICSSTFTAIYYPNLSIHS